MKNRISLKNLKSRHGIYIAILFSGIIAVFVRIISVQSERNRNIVSFVSEWEKNGKPVTVKEVKAADVPVYTKFTVISAQDGAAYGFVTGDIREKLAYGQAVYFNVIGASCGAIADIGQELDMDTGMFPVKVKLSNYSGSHDLKLVLFAQTQILKNAIVVPNEIVDTVKNVSHVWKILDGRAKKIKVEIGSRNGYGTAVVAGVQTGDQIVLAGQDLLSENDKVHIAGQVGAIKQ